MERKRLDEMLAAREEIRAVLAKYRLDVTGTSITEDLVLRSWDDADDDMVLLENNELDTTLNEKIFRRARETFGQGRPNYYTRHKSVAEVDAALAKLRADYA